MDSGNGRMTALLEQLVLGQEQNTAELRRLRADTQAGFAGVEQRFSGIEQRLDNIIKIVGSHHADHEQRLRALEEIVFKEKSG